MTFANIFWFGLFLTALATGHLILAGLCFLMLVVTA